jgi:hypothetical protein
MNKVRLDVFVEKEEEFERILQAALEFKLGNVDEEKRWIDLNIGKLQITVFLIKGEHE